MHSLLDLYFVLLFLFRINCMSICNTSSNTGYANGYTTGRSSTRTLKGKIEGIAQNLDSGLWSRFDVYLTDDDGNDNLVVRMMGTGTQNFELEITDSMWSD